MKSSIYIAAFVLIITCFLTPCFAEQRKPAIEETRHVYIGYGFATITGEYYLNMTKSEQRIYTMGLINGILLSPLFEAPQQALGWFEKCLQNMTDSQAAAIFTRYLDDHPERWHEVAHVLLYSALKEICPKK